MYPGGVNGKLPQQMMMAAKPPSSSGDIRIAI
jgi:hypothetical protein